MIITIVTTYILKIIYKSMNIENEQHLDKDFFEISRKIKKIYKNQNLDETAYTAYQTIKNIVNQKIEGCIVECGVYQGQKISFFLETLKKLKINNRDVYVIDTFEGMTEPSDNDYQVNTKKKMYKADMKVNLEIVKNNIYKTNYPREKVHFIKIDVRQENLLKNSIVGEIALIRLDTDFYDSTLSILNSLYYRVAKNGYLIHDDYGHWKGHYDACIKFYKTNNINPVLIRTSVKERVEIKC
jgi:O-methyltransferase